MSKIYDWIQEQIDDGISKKEIKRQLKTDGYSKDVINLVDEIETPYEQTLEQKDQRKKIIEVAAVVVVILSLAAGAYYTYGLYYSTTEEGILLNLSKSYGEVTAMQVIGRSMEPTFNEGDIVFIAKSADIFKESFVLIEFETANERFIRRVYATESEEIDPNNPIFADTLLLKQLEFYDYKLPENTIILLGDNPAKSIDSRQYGIVPSTYVVGKVVK